MRERPVALNGPQQGPRMVTRAQYLHRFLGRLQVVPPGGSSGASAPPSGLQEGPQPRDAAGTDKGVSGQRPPAGQFRGHQWAVFMAADTRRCLDVLAISPERSRPRVRRGGFFPGQSSGGAGGGARYCLPSGIVGNWTPRLLDSAATHPSSDPAGDAGLVPVESLGVDGDAEDGPADASDQTFDSREDSSRSPRPRSTLDGSGLADRNLLTGRVVGDGGDRVLGSIAGPVAAGGRG